MLAAEGSGLAPINCSKVEGWSYKSSYFSDQKLIFKIDGKLTIKQVTMVVRFPKRRWLVSPSDNLTIFEPDYLLISNMSIIVSDLEGAFESAGTPTTAALSFLQAAIMLVSIPQAFVLMKVL